ncbi:hypothetical protein FDP41_004594 [Naegleria fowleri]|uniref:Suppressor of forked domain-containing protein n=1 Tax=Naegleria fowleri TaxID=5763 RepID=A0A6A5BHH5_NAEFO|nr:uncharacterized protein FDP41_004594 [Naegleria fowleri]KAF0976367.1 hypothetical protein FDP41_004594 [Naegleria fowleri]
MLDPLFFVFSTVDYEFEEKIAANPFFLKTWLAYIQYKQIHQNNHTSYNNIINAIFERVLSCLPGSYKLWNMYLDIRIAQCEYLHPITRLDTIKYSFPASDGDLHNNNNNYSRSAILNSNPFSMSSLGIIESVNQVFENCLITMHKMPTIWLKYLKFVVRTQPTITLVRLIMNRALQALPVSQHDIVWKFIVWEWILNEQAKVPKETGCRLLKRYLKLDPSFIGKYLEYLSKSGYYSEMCELLMGILAYSSSDGRNFGHPMLHVGIAIDKVASCYLKEHSPLHVWNQFCSLISEQAQRINIPHSAIESVLVSGTKRYPSEIGKLWTTLAQYYIQHGKFDAAISSYEKGMSSVSTVKDFNLIFDTYAKMFDELIKFHMQLLEKGLDGQNQQELGLEVLISKYENLMDRRSFLLNSVKLKQNPNNIHEWHNRLKLIKNREQFNSKDSNQKADDIISCYEEAISNINPENASHGKIFSIWNSYARFFEIELHDLGQARSVYKKFLDNINYHDYPVSTMDVEKVVCDYVEMEIRNRNNYEALSILSKMIHSGEDTLKSSCRKSLSVWNLFLDLEESVNNNIKRMKRAYNEMTEMKIVTPATVINFTQFLIENRYFEEAFSAFERAISLFNYPQVYPIWTQYLLQFISRYQHTKLERTRDLFEQALSQMPFYSKERIGQQSGKNYVVKNSHARDFFLLYVKFEETFGMSSKSIRVFDRAIKSVSPNSQEQFQLYQLYITRVSELFGAAKTREVMDLALNQAVESNDASHQSNCFIRDLTLRYISIELKLGEVDRCRGLFGFAATFCNPENQEHFAKFWERWAKFEKQFGNVETFKEMLRVRRFIKQQYNSETSSFSNK